MELHELVERIQRWKDRQSAQNDNVSAAEELASSDVVAETEEAVSGEAAVNEITEPIDEDELEPGAEEQPEIAEGDEGESESDDPAKLESDHSGEMMEPVEVAGSDDSTSEIDLDQVDDWEEV